MESYQQQISELKQQIEQLEHENLCLKQLLDEAGISYKEKNIAGAQTDYTQEKYEQNQGARIEPIEINDKNANIFFMLFCRGRQVVTWHPDVYVYGKDYVRIEWHLTMRI
ncbi:hypothetical protein SAMN04487831_11242 [Pseudobutyrivibrio sp. UC1225]|nr:hypothetical protein SAMN04487831_11242 [Pseudobutyrivibrio sp. UC1225]